MSPVTDFIIVGWQHIGWLVNLNPSSFPIWETKHHITRVILIIEIAKCIYQRLCKPKHYKPGYIPSSYVSCMGIMYPVFGWAVYCFMAVLNKKKRQQSLNFYNVSNKTPHSDHCHTIVAQYEIYHCSYLFELMHLIETYCDSAKLTSF